MHSAFFMPKRGDANGPKGKQEASTVLLQQEVVDSRLHDSSSADPAVPGAGNGQGQPVNGHGGMDCTDRHFKRCLLLEGEVRKPDKDAFATVERTARRHA